MTQHKPKPKVTPNGKQPFPKFAGRAEEARFCDTHCMAD